MSVKLKGLPTVEEIVKKQFSLKKSDEKALSDYIEYLKYETGVEYPVGEIGGLIISNWLSKDVEFKRWMKNSKEEVVSPEAVPEAIRDIKAAEKEESSGGFKSW